MIKLKHTPGPWDWGLNDGQFQLEGNVEYKDMNPILVAFDCGCKVEKRESTPRCPLSPTDADMNLIAAAPEMLEVLIRRLKSDVKNGCPKCCYQYKSDNCNKCNKMKDIKIIEKATGLKWEELQA